MIETFLKAFIVFSILITTFIMSVAFLDGRFDSYLDKKFKDKSCIVKPIIVIFLTSILLSMLVTVLVSTKDHDYKAKESHKQEVIQEKVEVDFN